MNHTEMRDDRVIHVLPEERVVVKGIERYPVRSGGYQLNAAESRNPLGYPYSFSRSNCDFFGIISSI